MDKTPIIPEPTVEHKKPFNLSFKNKWLLFAAIAAAVVIAALVTLLWKLPTFDRLDVAVAYSEGTVEYRRSGDAQWQVAPKDLRLNEGAQVRTADNARVVLHIEDGSVIRLNAKSSVALDKLLPTHIIVRNAGGQMYTRVKKSTTRVFQVKSNAVTYQSQGTSYRTHATENLQGVEVYHGKVESVGLNGDEVILGQGQRYFVVNRNRPDIAGKVSEMPIQEIAADSFMVWNAEEDRKKFSHELGVLYDLKPPPLEISAPATDSTTDAASILVKGTTEADAKVLVNGTEVVNNDGTFESTVELSVGDNTITVEAKDVPGNKTVKTIAVKRTTPPATSTKTKTPSKTKATTPPPVVTDPAPTGTLTLASAGAKDFTWSNTGTALYGYRLVYSKNPNPVYSFAALITYGKDETSGTILAGPGTWYVRVCMYFNNDCAVYSNEVSIVVP